MQLICPTMYTLFGVWSVWSCTSYHSILIIIHEPVGRVFGNGPIHEPVCCKFEGQSYKIFFLSKKQKEYDFGRLYNVLCKVFDVHWETVNELRAKISVKSIHFDKFIVYCDDTNRAATLNGQSHNCRRSVIILLLF